MLRFAADPTRDFTVAQLRVALLTYLAAKKRGEKFIVRIDDGEKERNIEGKEREILDILALFGIHYDDVVYQSRNLTIHQQLAVRLLSERKAYACFCKSDDSNESPCVNACDKLGDAEVLENENPFVVRIKKPSDPLVLDDPILGRTSLMPDEIDSFVIMRTDKTPTRNFADSVDDMLYDVSLVVSEISRIVDTAKKIHVHRTLGYDRSIDYAHLPPILDENGKEEISDVKALLKEGFFPEAIANYLLVLGCKTPIEIFTLREATDWFDLDGISKEAAVFDKKELRRFNREHMRRMDPKELSRAFGFADAAIGEVVKCYVDEGSTVGEIKPKIDAIFAPKILDTAPMREIRAALEKAPPLESFEELESYLIQKIGLRGEALTAPLRRLLTGAEEGPDLSELYPHLKSYLQEIVQ